VKKGVIGMDHSMGHAVVLCADDYGYRPGVSAAIRRLAAAGRLSATSALVTFPDWRDAAAHLGELAGTVDVGLHLNLVEGAPLGPMPRLAPAGRFPTIGMLARMALGGGIDRGEIRDEVRRQVDAFTAAAGRLPDYLDGHQHAHALPGVGAAVLAALAEATGHHAIPVRDPSDRLARVVRRGGAVGKALAIAGLTRGFGRIAHRRGVPINDGFAGVYDFAPTADLDTAFARFLSHRGARHLVMCHPGAGEATDDPIAAARLRETAYLSSDLFAERLARGGLRLVRFTEVAVRRGPTAGVSSPGGSR
jgi:predicted glycoside hydrolase/deacetylase ChbG (UPF0249 family)